MVFDLNKSCSDEALHLIASFAEGSLRDAESLLDQIFCFAEGPIVADHVRDVLGLVPEELFFNLDRAFSEGRLAFAFELAEQLFQEGSKDPCHFAEQLIGHYRRLTLIKTIGSNSVFHPEPLLSQLIASSKLYTQSQLFHLLDILPSALLQLQKSPIQRVSLESLLLQILRSKQRIPVEVLVRQLHELEQKLLALPQENFVQAQELPHPELPEPEPFIPADKELKPLDSPTVSVPLEPPAKSLKPPCRLEPVPFNPLAPSVEESIPEPDAAMPSKPPTNLFSPVIEQSVAASATALLEAPSKPSSQRPPRESP